MLKNLLKTAFRHILKHYGYSILNILGLTIGITSALFLIIYVSDEVSYDRYNKNADRIYRVSSKITEPDDQFTRIVAQIPFGPQVAKDYPEVQSFVRFIPMARQELPRRAAQGSRLRHQQEQPALQGAAGLIARARAPGIAARARA